MESAFMNLTDYYYENESRRGATIALFRICFNWEL